MTSYYDSIKDDREDWRYEQNQVCMYCETPERHCQQGLQIHEIERRGHAPKAWGVRCNYLLVCQECHEKELAAMPHARQLAIKLLKDPRNFSLPLWLQIREPIRWPNDRVTLEDISQHLKLVYPNAPPPVPE